MPLNHHPLSDHWTFLVPTIGVLWQTGTLYSYRAEALASGCLHHHPTLAVLHDRLPSGSQSRDKVLPLRWMIRVPVVHVTYRVAGCDIELSLQM